MEESDSPYSLTMQKSTLEEPLTNPEGSSMDGGERKRLLSSESASTDLTKNSGTLGEH